MLHSTLVSLFVNLKKDQLRLIAERLQKKRFLMITFVLRGDYIALCDLLKTEGIAESGGQGKAFVADGLVKVDGKVELRKTAKIRAGQIVECMGETVKVVTQ